MHWWQLAIRLVLIANCVGNLRGAIHAGRERDWNRLHWLLPKTIGWTMLFFALLPARYGGIGRPHWEAIAGIGLMLLLYGLSIERTDPSQPRIDWTSVELPHVGRIDGSLMPLLMVILPILLLLLFIVEVVYRHCVITDIAIILIALLLMLSFSVRLLLRQYNLTRVSQLVELAKFRSHPVQAPAQHEWIKPDNDEAST